MTDPKIRQTLWVALAQALLPPTQPKVADAFLDGLAEELNLLANANGFGAIALNSLDDFQNVAARITGPDALLLDYSGLFLQPPTPAHLNLSYYAAGTLNGPVMDALEAAYAAHGVKRSERFHDLPDHVSMQFEFLALLVAEGANEGEQTFARLCLVPALPKLAGIVQDLAPNSPYGPLLRFAAAAVAPFAARIVPSPKKRRHDTASGVWHHCARCEKPYAREKEIQIMSKALARAGLPADHLDICPDCRGAAHGWSTRRLSVPGAGQRG